MEDRCFQRIFCGFCDIAKHSESRRLGCCRSRFRASLRNDVWTLSWSNVKYENWKLDHGKNVLRPPQKYEIWNKQHKGKTQHTWFMLVQSSMLLNIAQLIFLMCQTLHPKQPGDVRRKKFQLSMEAARLGRVEVAQDFWFWDFFLGGYLWPINGYQLIFLAAGGKPLHLNNAAKNPGQWGLTAKRQDSLVILGRELGTCLWPKNSSTIKLRTQFLQ